MDTGRRIVSTAPVLDTVAPDEWRDMNGHMNITYYTLLVTRYLDGWTDWAGFGADYRRAENASLFIVETRLRYRREILVGMKVRVTGAITGAAGKRLDIACAIAVDGTSVAEAHVVFVNVDLATRRSRPLPPQALARTQALVIAPG